MSSDDGKIVSLVATGKLPDPDLKARHINLLNRIIDSINSGETNPERMLVIFHEFTDKQARDVVTWSCNNDTATRFYMLATAHRHLLDLNIPDDTD